MNTTLAVSCRYWIASVFTVAMCLAGTCMALNPNPRLRHTDRIEASYAAGEIANIAVDTEYGQVFFDAGKEHYVWELKVENLADKLQAALAVVDRIGHAARIDVSRWPSPGNGRPDRAIYRKGILYYCVDGLDLVYRIEVKQSR